MRDLFYIILLFPSILFAQIEITNQKIKGKNSFEIANSKSVATIVYDTFDFKVVQKISELLASDIEMVTNKKPQLLSANSKMNYLEAEPSRYQNKRS